MSGDLGSVDVVREAERLVHTCYLQRLMPPDAPRCAPNPPAWQNSRRTPAGFWRQLWRDLRWILFGGEMP